MINATIVSPSVTLPDAAANLDCDRPTAAGGNVAAAAAVESILIDIIWGV